MEDRDDFAEQATDHWHDLFSDDVLVDRDEIAAAVRLSRLSMLQDRIDARALRSFEFRGIAGVDDFRLIALLRRLGDDGQTNTALVKQLGGSKAGVSNRLDRLVQAGIVERTPSTVDRRSHTNSLTGPGRELADEVVEAILRARHAMFVDLSQKQVSQLASTLADMIQSVNPDG